MGVLLCVNMQDPKEDELVFCRSDTKKTVLYTTGGWSKHADKNVYGRMRSIETILHKPKISRIAWGGCVHIPFLHTEKHKEKKKENSRKERDSCHLELIHHHPASKHSKFLHIHPVIISVGREERKRERDRLFKC